MWYVVSFSLELLILDYKYYIFKQLGHVMRTNLPVELVIQGAFHKKDHATNWMIVLMGVTRLQHSVVSVPSIILDTVKKT